MLQRGWAQCEQAIASGKADAVLAERAMTANTCC